MSALHSNAPVRVGLFDVAARHRRLMESDRAGAPAVAVAAPAPAKAPAPRLSLGERRTALTSRLAAIQEEMVSAPRSRREVLTKELIRVQSALSAVRAELRAEYDATERVKVPMIQELLEIIDRYQDAGAPLSDAEIATLNRAAEWLEINGGGER